MIKFRELSKSVQLVLSAGAVATALVAIAVPTVWALDTRYVTLASVEQAFLKRDIRDIRRHVAKLEWLRDNNQATDLDLFELHQLQQELLELTE